MEDLLDNLTKNKTENKYLTFLLSSAFKVLNYNLKNKYKFTNIIDFEMAN